MAKKKIKLSFKKKKSSAPKVKKGFINRIHKKAKNILPLEDQPFAPLLIFKGTMKRRLDKKNIKHGSSLKDITIAFAKNVSEGKHFETFIDLSDGVNNHLADDVVSGVGGAAAIATNAGLASAGDPNAIMNLVKMVVGFFSGLSKKKKEHERLTAEGKETTPMPEEEKELATDAEEETKKAIEADNADSPIPDFLTSPIFLSIIAFLLLILAFA